MDERFGTANQTVDDCPARAATLERYFFAARLTQLHKSLRALFDDFDNWTDETLFEAIGDIVGDLAVEGGVMVTCLALRITIALRFSVVRATRTPVTT